MEAVFTVAFGVIMAAAVYLILSRNLLRMILGFLLFSNGINLSIFIAGRMDSGMPPLLVEGQDSGAVMANPLPQALILTAIVVSFALTIFAVALFQRAHRLLQQLDTDQMRLVEPSAPSDQKEPV